jgi:biopolymer transport protein ExbB/TolQ
VYAYAFGLGLMVMMVMVMGLVMVLVMVMVMVMVQNALSQVGWLRQRQRQSFNRLKAFYRPKLPQTQSFHTAKSFPWKTLHLPKRGFVKLGTLEQAPKQAIKQAVKQLSSRLSSMLSSRLSSASGL